MRPVALPSPPKLLYCVHITLGAQVLALTRIDLMGGEVLMLMLLWELAALWHCFIRMLREFVRCLERRIQFSDGIVPSARCQGI